MAPCPAPAGNLSELVNRVPAEPDSGGVSLLPIHIHI